MRNKIVTLLIGLLILSVPAIGVSTLAQNAERGTTLVCVGRADGFVVEEWTPEQIGQFGLYPVHPETGDCRDPAGLWVGMGWNDQYSWLCSQDAETRWFGPYWVHSHFRFGEDASPDPTTGNCPTP